MQLKIKATPVFERNWEALLGPHRFIRNEGGSRSSKTYSICQCLILWCLQNPNKLVSVIRKTSPALAATVMRDFFDVLRSMEIYDEAQHSKMERTYRFGNGSAVEFFSVDNEQKLRGRKRDIAWCNEANELFAEDFKQLNLRTTEKIIVDYNPSEIESWCYHLPPDNTQLIHSTYKDNPFLESAIIREIEDFQHTDMDYYTIFALGKRAFSRENVYQQWSTTERPIHLTDWIYAIDFGYQHPTALIKIWFTPGEREVWVEELIYESHLTSSDILQRMSELNVDRSKTIVSEVARPEIIADLRRAGYRVQEANKNVKDGINTVKTYRVTLSPKATNVIKENENYRWKKVNGELTEEVNKMWDDAMDALRYGIMYLKKHHGSPSLSGHVYSFNL